MKEYIVFSDFDGTITEQDVIMSIMQKFAPIKWKEIRDKIFNREITISEGVAQLFSLIPSNKKDEIIKWCLENISIRKGFKEFLEFLREKDIPFIVLSGGLDFYIFPILKPYLNLITKVYCNQADFSENYIKVKFNYQCDPLCDDDCGMCKTSVIRKYQKYYEKIIYVGDSITDIDASKISDIVFARDFLAKKLDEVGIKYFEYENFYDIKNRLQTIIKLGE
jgi:2-hydroxy-3-keto-5-methylthiopentenyl-1-phosphate phosphatase